MPVSYLPILFPLSLYWKLLEICFVFRKKKKKKKDLFSVKEDILKRLREEKQYPFGESEWNKQKGKQEK